MDFPIYQDHELMTSLVALLKARCKEGEKVIWRDAFRWKDDDGVRSNHYECQDLEQLADDHGFTVVANFCHAAIIAERTK